jgi:hypothetical protein
MKEGSNKDNVRTYDMNISANERTDPLYNIPDSDSISNKESMRRREMKRAQKYGIDGFHMPKQIPPYGHHSYTDLFPVFCAHCFYKVDLAYLSWQCRGHCGKVFHDRCKKALDSNYLDKDKEDESNPSDWLCWLCSGGKAECFICKKIEFVKWNSRKPVPSYIKNNPALVGYYRSNFPSRTVEPSSANKDPKDDTYNQMNSEVSSKIEEKEETKSVPVPEPAQAPEVQKETEITFRFDNEPAEVTVPVSISPNYLFR